MIFTRADINLDGLLSFYEIQKVVEIMPLKELVEEELVIPKDSVIDDEDSGAVLIIVIVITVIVLVILGVVFGYLIMKKR